MPCDKSEVGEVLLSAEQIAEGVREVAAQINRDYEGREVVLVGVLTGAAVFLSDLMRQLEMPLRVDFVALASYGDHTVSSGEARLVKDLTCDIEGRDVLVVEDIIDTGLSLQAVLELLRQRGAASVKTVCLLDKPARREVEVTPDYCAFEIPDAFVVGYGLDYAQKYRNLPYIAVLRPEGDR